MRTERERYTSDTPRTGAVPVAGFDHQVSTRTCSDDHRIGHQRHAGKLMRQLRHGARHVVVRGDDDQRPEASVASPSAAFRWHCRWCWWRERSRSTQQANQRWYSGISRAISLRAGAGLTPVISRRRPRPAASSSSASSMRNAAAGQHDDAVGVSVGRCLDRRQQRRQSDTGSRRPSTSTSKPSVSSVARRPRRRGRRAPHPSTADLPGPTHRVADASQQRPRFNSPWPDHIAKSGRWTTRATRPFRACG